MVVHSLTPERKDDFLAYFDHEAFSDNAEWATCYCFCYSFGGGQEAWNVRTGEENRRDQSTLIANGDATGYLAYAGGKVVGWCHAVPRGVLPALEEPTADGEEVVGAFVCFNVAPRYRGHGLARALLGAACDGLAAQGCTVAEAYPPISPDSDARAYRGPLRMYLAAGFTEVRREGPYAVVRKSLRP